MQVLHEITGLGSHAVAFCYRVVVVSLQNPQGRQGVTGNPLSPLHQEPCLLCLLCTTLVPGGSPVAALFLFTVSAHLYMYHVGRTCIRLQNRTQLLDKQE